MTSKKRGDIRTEMNAWSFALNGNGNGMDINITCTGILFYSPAVAI
jgi:hypothetical protein